MARKRLVVIVTGVVQGVYFRDYTQREARSLSLSGWVRNRPDGTVVAVIEGEDESVAQMVEWLKIGSPMAQVSDIQVTEEKPLGDTTAFAIRYS